MTIHILNGFTCNARIPRHWYIGMTCLQAGHMWLDWFGKNKSA
jgi:hypothetical protein